MHYNGNSSNGYNSGYSPAGDQSDSYDEQEIDLLKILNILLLHKWAVVGITGIITVLAVFFCVNANPHL